MPDQRDYDRHPELIFADDPLARVAHYVCPCQTAEYDRDPHLPGICGVPMSTSVVPPNYEPGVVDIHGHLEVTPWRVTEYSCAMCLGEDICPLCRYPIHWPK